MITITNSQNRSDKPVESLIAIKDKDLKYFHCNTQFLQFFEVSKNEIIGKSDDEIFGANIKLDIQTIEENIKNTKTANTINEILKKDNKNYEFITHREVILDKDGNFDGIVIIYKFFKNSKKLKEQLETNITLLEQYKNAVDLCNIVSKTDLNGVITYANKEFEKISGYKIEELIGKKHNIIRHKDMSNHTFKDLWNTIIKKESWNGIVKNRAKNGKAYFVDSTIVPILDSYGEISEFIAIRKDITKLIKQQKKLKKQLKDKLTNLPNRNALKKRLKKLNAATIILINIDMFSEINSFYGEHIGDKVIKQLANFLKNQISDNDKLYKLQADEYAILINREFSDYQIERKILDLHQKISSLPIETTDSAKINITTTFGVGYGNKKSIISKANTAFKYAKTNKRIFYIYNDEINERQNNNLKWIRILKHAIAENRIIPYYQPIINNQTGLIEKYEGLVRLIDENGTVIPPMAFLSIAKKSRLYPYITKAVIENVIKIAKEKEFDFSINISVEDIINKTIRENIINILKNHYCKNKSCLIFEITESENIENYAEVSEFIKEIKNYGCKVAIDDFGSGYSNFEHLAHLNIDYIKLDGALIKNIDKDKNLRIITKTIVDFSKELGIKTVAEFIHSEEVFQITKDLGIDYSQGYYFGEPQKI